VSYGSTSATWRRQVGLRGDSLRHRERADEWLTAHAEAEHDHSKNMSRDGAKSSGNANSPLRFEGERVRRTS
jgi:hypothetical protein